MKNRANYMELYLQDTFAVHSPTNAYELKETDGIQSIR